MNKDKILEKVIKGALVLGTSAVGVLLSKCITSGSDETIEVPLDTATEVDTDVIADTVIDIGDITETK